MHERRDKACAKLESAETNLFKAAAKAIKKNKVENAPTAEELSADPSLMSRYVAPKARPHHKLGFLGLFGKKCADLLCDGFRVADCVRYHRRVDSIEWAREEIATTNKELDEARVVLSGAGANDKYPAESAAFVQFNTQIAAHMFAQYVPLARVAFAEAQRLTPRPQVPRPSRPAPHVGSLPRSRSGECHLEQPFDQPLSGEGSLRHLVGYDDRAHRSLVLPWCVSPPLLEGPQLTSVTTQSLSSVFSVISAPYAFKYPGWRGSARFLLVSGSLALPLACLPQTSC